MPEGLQDRFEAGMKVLFAPDHPVVEYVFGIKRASTT